MRESTSSPDEVGCASVAVSVSWNPVRDGDGGGESKEMKGACMLLLDLVSIITDDGDDDDDDGVKGDVDSDAVVKRGAAA
jgi:hypothetical protein